MLPVARRWFCIDASSFENTYLTYETVKVGISGTLNVHIRPTDVIDSFVVNHEGTIGEHLAAYNCDTIKGNESHVGNIQFWFLNINLLSI